MQEEIKAEVARQVKPLREALEAMWDQMQAAQAAQTAQAAAAPGPDPDDWPPTGWFQPRAAGLQPARPGVVDEALAAQMERQAAERNRVKQAAVQARIARIEQHAATRGAWRHSQGGKP
ncbi:MAG: hypothetical protein RIA71_07860 [Oceanicaulis sp.]